MSNRLGGFIAGQNVNVAFSTFTAVTSPTFTFSSAQATPDVGQPVQFTTTGTLPTGLSTNTTYYVISKSTNTCQFSTAQSGSAVTFTNSSGSGTHTAVTQRAFSPYAGAPDTVEYLVVAGGGAGGSNGGGGGAGGLLTAAGFSVTSGTAYTVTVGAGGVGQNYNNRASITAGSSSVFGSISTTGGGQGGTEGINWGNGTAAGASGGSGGGGGYNTSVTLGGSGTAGQGNAGGTNANPSANQFGGGGGAGSVGVNAINGTLCGPGGTGVCSTITGARVFYAGGGGGGTAATGDSDKVGIGGGGGGGDGGFLTGFSGRANTGGGGGGSQASSAITGSGGSGIVIIRYPQVNAPPALVTGAPQVSYADGYQIYTWTSSGSIIF